MLPPITYPESCYNCTRDCEGILSYVFKNPEDNSHANFLISSIIEDKGYYNVNYSHTVYKGKLEPCISLYKQEAGKFMSNMIELGYQITFTWNRAKNYLTDIIIRGDKMNLFLLFLTLLGFNHEPARLKKKTSLNEKIDNWAMEHASFILLLCILVFSILFCILIYTICGVGVESGVKYNHMGDVI